MDGVKCIAECKSLISYLYAVLRYVSFKYLLGLMYYSFGVDCRNAVLQSTRNYTLTFHLEEQLVDGEKILPNKCKIQ